MKRILIGGSPCTFWSIAQKDRETEASGQGWELFKNYLLAKEKFTPDYFIYENNHSISNQIKSCITKELGVTNQTINSSIVSAQERKREYWHNGPKTSPQPKNIRLQDVLISGLAEREKAFCLDASYYKGGNARAYFVKHRRTQVFETEQNGRPPILVSDGFVDVGGNKYKANLPNGIYYPRNLTATEAARLQTMPDDYCKAVSRTQAIKCLGNGWTANVILHIMREMLADVDRNEPIIVLSMYDGIGTGRYCLDQLGFKNITYYAYEIDSNAIKIAKDNWPDITELGDAFQLRNDDWKLE